MRNPPADYFFRHRIGVKQKPLAEIVRQNVEALRSRQPKRMGQRAFAEFCGVGEATIWRISKGQAGTSIETLRAIADAHGLDAWQLLVDGFHPDSPPTLAPLTDAERRLYAAIKQASGSTAGK